jgi:hypothetical protein
VLTGYALRAGRVRGFALRVLAEEICKLKA